MITVQYTDEHGISRYVDVPDEATPREYGIPRSLMIDHLFADAPKHFLVRLYAELHQLGLIEPADYRKPGAADKIASAFRAAVRQDVVSILNEAEAQ